jgi:hypothetical protein
MCKTAGGVMNLVQDNRAEDLSPKDERQGRIRCNLSAGKEIYMTPELS